MATSFPLVRDKKATEYEEMAVKTPLYSRFRQNPGARAFRQYLLLVISLFLTIVYVIPRFLQTLDHDAVPALATTSSSSSAFNSTVKVPLEAHIMSKCPDARDCLRDLIIPAMEDISDQVNFTLSYIASMDQDGGVECKHGQTECLGNMLGLCAAELYPTDVKRSLGFMTCMVLSYKEIASRELVQHCALEHGVDFDRLNGCASEEGHGLDLLEASAQRTLNASVTKSCTVRVNGEKWCIRDGGQWKDCPEGHEVTDLVKAVTKRFNT